MVIGLIEQAQELRSSSELVQALPGMGSLALKYCLGDELGLPDELPDGDMTTLFEELVNKSPAETRPKSDTTEQIVEGPTEGGDVLKWDKLILTKEDE